MDRRRRDHDAIGARLAALTDDELVSHLQGDPAGWRAHVHGGRSGVIEVEGRKVFVKQIALTDLERDPANRGATANLFGLPLFYQYGVGSAGFGAWRELAAYVKASAWTLSGECPYFPLLYHWRVLPREVAPITPEQRARIDLFVDYWDSSQAVRRRVEAIAAASASIVLFLECVPEMLDSWMKRNVWGRSVDPSSEAAILRFHDQLRDTAAFMNERAMLHFDLHGQNVLTDGEQIYAADFGLALCGDFELSAAERAFYETHRLYDRGYVLWAFNEQLAPKDHPPVLTDALRERLDRYAPVAEIVRGFIGRLKGGKTAPYPAAELEAALGALENSNPAGR